MNERRKSGRFRAGFLSAVALGWLTIALLLLLDAWVFSDRIRHSQATSLITLLFVVHLTCLPFIGFVAGLVSAFFWHSTIDRTTCERWGTPVVALIFAPLLLLGIWVTPAPFVVLPIAFVCALSPFHYGINVGFRWWGEGYWRHFVGLSNEWEREEDER